MPIKVQNASATGKLAQFFSLKGRYLPSLDEIIVPVAMVADLSDDPGPATPQVFQERFTIANNAVENPEILFRGASDTRLCLPLAVILRGSGADAYEMSLENNTNAVALTANAVTRGIALTGTHGEGPVICQAGTSAALTGNTVAMWNEAATTVESVVRDLSGWELRFQDVLRIRGVTANRILDATLIWTYRDVD